MNAIEPGWIALSILAPIMLSMVALCYIAHRYTEHFESLLSNCTYVTGNKKLFEHAGLLGKVMRTGAVSLVLAMPRIFLRRGLIDADEVDRFPLNLKRLLVGLLIIQAILLIALILFGYVYR